MVTEPQMENLPIKIRKNKKKLFLTDASLYCRLAENLNARPILLNRNQLLSERLETVQCEMHFFGVIFNFSRVFLISASKTRHIPPRGLTMTHIRARKPGAIEQFQSHA